MLVCLPSKERGSDGLRDLPKSGLVESGGTTTHSHCLALQTPLPSHTKEKRTCQTGSTRRHHTSSLYPSRVDGVWCTHTQWIRWNILMHVPTTAPTGGAGHSATRGTFHCWLSPWCLTAPLPMLCRWPLASRRLRTLLCQCCGNGLAADNSSPHPPCPALVRDRHLANGAQMGLEILRCWSWKSRKGIPGGRWLSPK